jgi:hypothetical protein
MTAGSNVLADRQEHRVVVSVGDPVQVPLHPSDVVALAADRGAERGRGTSTYFGEIGDVTAVLL